MQLVGGYDMNASLLQIKLICDKGFDDTVTSKFANMLI